MVAAGPASALQPASATASSGPSAAACTGTEAARVRQGAKRSEPRLYRDAHAYGMIPDEPTLAAGSVEVETVFHVITDARQSAAERARSSR